MKKNLFLQEIYAVMLSLVITVIIAFSLSGIFGALLKIPIKNGRISADTVVMKNNEVEYSTRELSAVERQSLIICLKSENSKFESGGIEYNTSAETFKDGTSIITLEPNIDTEKLYAVLTGSYVLIFLLCYAAVMWYLGKKRDNDIIKPLLDLTNQTQRLTEGDFDVNIPDEGMEEIRLLAKCIENLRIRLKDEVYLNKKASDDRQFLISSISHDLRTPVTALKGYIEGILDGVADSGEKQRLYLEKSIEKTELINRMISDLLTYSKLDLNQVEFKWQMINIAAYLSAFTEENKLIFKQENKRISFDLRVTTEYNVYVDLEQLDRVMGNVIENALRYTCAGSGVVQIILREASGAVIIEIRDNGVGIAEEDISKIFDRFYRGEKSRKIKGSSGLGLAISKRIVENMGGRIWAKSKLGEGTSIMISLKKYKDTDGYEKNFDN